MRITTTAARGDTIWTTGYLSRQDFPKPAQPPTRAASGARSRTGSIRQPDPSSSPSTGPSTRHNKPHWATRFAVEAVCDAERRKQLVCHCFYGEMASDVRSCPFLVVGYLLAQLNAVQNAVPTANGGANAGSRHVVPASVLKIALGCRLVDAEFQSATIILDRIDVLFQYCKADSKAIERFASFMRTLRWLMRSTPAVRVMVTS